MKPGDRRRRYGNRGSTPCDLEPRIYLEPGPVWNFICEFAIRNPSHDVSAIINEALKRSAKRNSCWPMELHVLKRRAFNNSPIELDAVDAIYTSFGAGLRFREDYKWLYE